MNTSRFDNTISFNNSSLININFFEKPNLSKIDEYEDNKYIKSLIRAYELFRNFKLDEALITFKSMLTESQSNESNEKTSECLVNIGIILFYQGKLSKGYYYLLESYKFFNTHMVNSLTQDLLKVRLLCNLIMLSIALNICDTALEYNEVLMEFLNISMKLKDYSYNEALFDQAVKSFFFFPDFFESKFNFDRLFDKSEEYKNGNNTYLKYKSFASIVTGYMKYIQNEKNIEYFSRCLVEAINNLKLINDNYTLSLALLSLSLLKIKCEDLKNSKVIAMDCFKILKLTKNFENTYAKLINEQYQKFEACGVIYNSLFNFYINYIDKGNREQNNSLNFQNKSKRSYIMTVLKKVKKELLFASKNKNNESFVETDVDLILQNIDFAMEIIEKNEGDIEKILHHLQVDSILKFYFENIGNNLMLILYREKMKKYFKRFLAYTLGFDEVSKFRENLKKMIIEPRLKNYSSKCIEFIESGIPVFKLNFSSFGKTERFLKFDRFESCYVISDSMKFKTSSNSNINLADIKEICLGVKSQNLRIKFNKFKKDFFKRSWRYISFITETRSYDLCIKNEESLRKIFYAFIIIKEQKKNNYKLLTRQGFSLHFLKLKLIHIVVKFLHNNFNIKVAYFGNLKKIGLLKEFAYYVNTSWSLVRLILFCRRFNLRIPDELFNKID
jgi:hypothetical protein